MEDKEQAKGNEAKRFGAGVNKRRVLTVVMLVVMAWGAWYFTRMAAGFDGDEAVWDELIVRAAEETAPASQDIGKP